MKLIRSDAIVILMCSALIITACGGGADKETNGSLTITAPTLGGPTGGVFTVSETITYTPPAGKVPNATPVVVSISNPSTFPPTVTSETHFLDSTGSFTLSDLVLQGLSASLYTISASTGDLQASRAVIIAGVTALSVTPTTIAFVQTDLAGTVKTATISGGISPYVITSNSSADIDAVVSGSTLSITKISLTGAVQKQATITITDSASTSVNVLVFYF